MPGGRPAVFLAVNSVVMKLLQVALVREEQWRIAMRYYFHVRSHDGLALDPEGAEFESLNAACDEAFHSAREILADRLLRGEVIDGEVFEITMENGDIVRTVPFRDSVKFEP